MATKADALVGPREFGRSRDWATAVRVRERRQQLGLTQDGLAERLAGFGLRYNGTQIGFVEKGQGVDNRKLPAFAAALECSWTYLLGGTDDPEKWEPDRPLDQLVMASKRSGKAHRRRSEHVQSPLVAALK